MSACGERDNLAHECFVGIERCPLISVSGLLLFSLLSLFADLLAQSISIRATRVRLMFCLRPVVLG